MIAAEARVVRAGAVEESQVTPLPMIPKEADATAGPAPVEARTSPFALPSGSGLSSAPLLPPEEPDDGPSLADLFAPRKPAAPAAPPTALEAETWSKVERVIDELRPFINADGGDIRLVAIKDGVVQVKLSGACVGCSSSLVTLQLGVERKVKEEVPGVKYVEAV